MTLLRRLTLLVVLCGTVSIGLSAVVHGFMTAVSSYAAEPLDINTATAEQLMTLPGIGDTFSKKILAGRPYKRKDELVQKNIIPQATYDKIKDQIVAKQK